MRPRETSLIPETPPDQGYSPNQPVRDGLAIAIALQVTRRDLKNEIARTCELPVRDAARVLDIVLSSMGRQVAGGDTVEIRGFGTFHTVAREARAALNPKTRKDVAVPAKRVARFRASRQFLKELNEVCESER